jgi:hypothetical protein
LVLIPVVLEHVIDLKVGKREERKEKKNQEMFVGLLFHEKPV